jgi:integrase
MKRVKRKLTLMADGRWRKVYRGKIYYFRGDYASCLKEWETVKVIADNSTGYGRIVEQLRAYSRLQEALANAPLRLFQNLKRTATVQEIFALHASNVAADEGGEQTILHRVQQDLSPFSVDFEPKDMNSLVNQLTAPISEPNSLSVLKCRDKFLERQNEKYKAGSISAGRLDIITRDAKRFCDFLGLDNAIEKAITGDSLERYHSSCLQLISSGKSRDYAKKIFDDAKQFVRWVYMQSHIAEMPRNMLSDELKITVPTKKIVTFTADEIHFLLAKASERVRLWMLLALNCGYTQVDISDLGQDQVDWQRGVITRKRSKTENVTNVPEISYPLWSSTFALLKKLRGEHETLALTDAEKPLLSNTVNGTSGKSAGVNVRTVDVITNEFKKLKSPKPFKIFRKTGSSLLAGNKHYATLSEAYLGHALVTIASKHYLDFPTELFGEAIFWLGEHLKIE